MENRGNKLHKENGGEYARSVSGELHSRRVRQRGTSSYIILLNFTMV